MHVTREQIRARLATIPTEELHTILASTGGEYTAETYEVALDELARRGEDLAVPEPDVYENAHRRTTTPQLGVKSSGATFLTDDSDYANDEVSHSSSEESQAPFLLLPHEEVLSTFAGTTLVLTTHRVRSYGDALGRSSVTSIMLDQIASISMVSLSKPWLWIIGALLMFGSLAAADQTDKGWVAGVVVSIAFIAAYFITRRKVLSVASAAAAIAVDAAGASKETMHEIIDSIEAAQDARYQALARSQ
jgi:subtilisin family serine protease